MQEPKAQMKEIWKGLYPEAEVTQFENFINKLDDIKGSIEFPERDEGWYKDAIVYSETALGNGIIKDLVVDRSAFDRIMQAGGFVSVNTSGNTQDANALPINKEDADLASRIILFLLSSSVLI